MNHSTSTVQKIQLHTHTLILQNNDQCLVYNIMIRDNYVKVTRSIIYKIVYYFLDLNLLC